MILVYAMIFFMVLLYVSMFPYFHQRKQVETLSIHKANIHLFAWYFPQFYPFPENNRVFGENYTEWLNVRAHPDKNQFGVNIPKPASKPLGYYDLRDIKPRITQEELAKKYGIDGFIYYHYWMENHAVMEEVLMRRLKDGHPNQRFALCWCSEDW